MEPLGIKAKAREDELPLRTTSVPSSWPGRRLRASRKKMAVIVAVSLACGWLTLCSLGWTGLHLPRCMKQSYADATPLGSPQAFNWDLVRLHRLRSSPIPQLPHGTHKSFQVKPSAALNWYPCYDGQECARLLLPLDYTDASDTRTIAVALHRIPSPMRGTSAHRGAVFFNPGGPGGSGTLFTVMIGRAMAAIIGEGYDVLGFDPRGVGASIPRVDCFGNKAEREIWDVQGGYQLLNVSDDTVAMYRARERLVGRRCEEWIGGEGGITRFVGTPSVARDMVEIAKKLGQEKVHYWGFVSHLWCIHSNSLY